MAHEALAAGTAQAARIAVEAAFLALEPGWTIRAGLRLADASADYLLLHARKGIAVIDVGQSCGDACAALHGFLARQGFASFFPGTLPIVRVVWASAGRVTLAERLDAAFAAVPALTIAEADWAAAVRLLVAAAQSPGWPVPLQDRSDPEPAAEPRFAAPAWTAAAPVALSLPPAATPGRDAAMTIGPAGRRRHWPAASAIVVAVLGAGGVWLALDRQSPHVAALELALPPAATPVGPEPARAPDASAPAEATPASVLDRAPAPAAMVPASPPPLPARKPLLLRAVAARPVAAAARTRDDERSAAAAPRDDLVRRNCRAYSAAVTVLGHRQAVTGMACQAQDGSWQLVSEAPR